MAEGRTNAGGGGFNKSVIIVTAPTGSTVTCTKGTTVKTASEKNGEWWFKNLDIGTWTLKATLSGQTATQTFNITQFGVYRVLMSYRLTPEFTYTGSSQLLNDNDQPISDFPNYKGNWKIKFLTSGTFKVINMYGWDGRIDLFLVGGGGGGGKRNTYGGAFNGGGGGGGYTKTVKAITVSQNTSYTITVGAGGSANTNGGTTSAFSNTASGGKGPTDDSNTYVGGAGGSGGGHGNTNTGVSSSAGGSDGGDGGSGSKGQGTTTREFGLSGGTLYSGGGGGAKSAGGEGGGANGETYSGGGSINAAENTGGGGGGSENPSYAGSGGSGIVIIRNAR